MEKSALIWLILLVLLPVSGRTQHCHAHTREKNFLVAHPEWPKKKAQIESFTQDWIKENRYRLKSGASYRIPVVVHIVWHELEENISEEQVLSQIAVLNQDFQALNMETALVPSTFKALIADTEISFCLANTDPAGNLSNGITRTQTPYTDIGTAQDETGHFRIFYSEAGGQDGWDPEKYLNIWVGRRGYGSGLASFPGTSPATEDGLVIDYRFFGTTGSALENAPYNLGRTVTHEIGHYFNLLHPWGSTIEPSCDMDDQVEDTPRQESTYLRECPSDQPTTCDTPDFFFNFMNYTDDACMAMFTIGQKMRMLAALAGPRSALLEGSTLCPPLNTTTNMVSKVPAKVWTDFETNRVWIEPSDQQPMQIELYLHNVLGQGFLNQQLVISDREALDLPKLPPGLYLLQLQWRGRSAVHKIIIP